MRIEQLRYVVEVANTGSMTLAAERLHLSQPNISNAIAALEQEIGVAIFTRTRAGTYPTESGQPIIDMAKDLLARWDHFAEAARLNDALVNEPLIIGATHAACTSFVPKLLASFADKYPFVNLQLIESDPLEIEEKLRKGDWHLGLVGTPGETDFDHLVKEKFLTCRLMACVSSRSPLSTKATLSMDDLLEHVIFGTSKHMSDELHRYGEVREIFNSKHSEFSKRVISEGLGIGFYSEVCLRDDPYVMSGRVIPIPLEKEQLVEFYYLHTRNPLTTACAHFIQELHAVIDTLMKDPALT